MWDTGNALEPVVVAAMERAGWQVVAAHPANPNQVSVGIMPGVQVVGHPDGVARNPDMGEDGILEIKTRGTDAFKRWHTLGAERSHPATVAQLAIYTWGMFGERRDGVIATMDTGRRIWDYEIIPAARLDHALSGVYQWLLVLHEHLQAETVPDCDGIYCDCPGGAVVEDEPDIPDEAVTEEDARLALVVYLDAHSQVTEPAKVKKAASATLTAWARARGGGKLELDGHTITTVQSRRYSTDYKKLNELLAPDVRATIVTEKVSDYVRVK